MNRSTADVQPEGLTEISRGSIHRDPRKASAYLLHPEGVPELRAEFHRSSAKWTRAAWSIFLCASILAVRSNATSAGTNAPVAATNSAAGDLLPADQDEAWKVVSKAFQPPMPPAEWQQSRPTPEEFEAYRLNRAKLAGNALNLAREFWTKFPDSPKVPEAKRRAENLHFAILNEAAQNSLRVTSLEERKEKLPEQERAARDLIKEFPDKKEGYEYLLFIASTAPAEKSQQIVKELVDGKAPEEIKAKARGMQWKLDAVGKELKLAFTDVKGREVDVNKLRGKVVLVDFWATWCGPCVQELPNVKMAYEKLHDKGFEIVGISLDSDKDRLTKFLADKEMTWPQYFDGKGWKNKYAQEFGINSIPSMWLVDKQGKLRDLEARGGLDEKVEKLLNE